MANPLLQLRRFSSSWLSAFVRWALLSTIAGVMFFSLKGVGETLTPWSQATVSLLANLFYPESGRDDVTVLLFREQDLTSLGPKDHSTGKQRRLSFPLPYSSHIETLNALGNWSPRAVLIDFAFVDARVGDDVEALLGAICDLSQQGTKVYLATFYHWQEFHGLRKDLFVDEQGHQRTECFTVVPVSYTPEGNGLAQTYSLIQGGGKTQKVPSAALRMYADGNSVDITKYTQKMDLIWGALPPRPNRSDTPCRPVSLFDSALRLAKDGPHALERDCPYSNTLSAYSLWNESSDDVEALLKGKFVLYGGAFLGTDDWLKSPVHGVIPGIYLHAMALDNLQVFGETYKRVAEHTLSADMPSVLFADGLIICIGVAWYLMIAHFGRMYSVSNGHQALKASVWRLARFYSLMVIPYVLLSLFAGWGLWLTGSPLSAAIQGVCLGLLIATGGVAIVYGPNLTLPKSVSVAGIMIGERLIEYSWVALMALLSGIVFYTWNLGPRNFWAFTAFIGFTQLIDKRLILVAGQIKKRQIRKIHRTAPWLTRLIFLVGFTTLTGTLVFAFSVKGLSGQFVGFGSVLGACAVMALLALVIVALPWIYRNELVLVDFKREKAA